MDPDSGIGQAGSSDRPAEVNAFSGKGVQVGDHNLQQNVFVEQWAAAAPVALAQLPPLVTGFTGRETELAQVAALLDPAAAAGAVVVSAVAGLAGVGKTALDVTVLDQAAAVRLLDRVLRAARPGDDRVSGDQAAAARLADLSGGLPLALQITAALLAADPVLSAAELAGGSVPGKFSGRDDAPAWLDAQRLNLIAAAAMAAATGRDREAMHLPLALSTYLQWRRRFDDWLTVLTISRDTARRLADRHSEGAALNNLGLALRGSAGSTRPSPPTTAQQPSTGKPATATTRA
jgi:hypothetical protein